MKTRIDKKFAELAKSGKKAFVAYITAGDPSLADTVEIVHELERVGVDIVDARKGSLMLDTQQSMLSLVTCYPFDALEAGGPLRYVVTARMLY